MTYFVIAAQFLLAVISQLKLIEKGKLFEKITLWIQLYFFTFQLSYFFNQSLEKCLFCVEIGQPLTFLNVAEGLGGQ